MGVEVSIDSASEMRSALCFSKKSESSRSSLVFRPRRKSCEKMRPEILPFRTSAIIRLASGWSKTAFPETASRW
jgi:hypothetical protein